MTRRTALRASDADREQVAELLRHAAAEGRLFADELEERLGAALSARTYGELDALVADLPRPAMTPTPRRSQPPRLRNVAAIGIGLPLALMVLIVAALATAGSAQGGHGGPGPVLVWLVIIAFGWRWFSRHRSGGGPNGR